MKRQVQNSSFNSTDMYISVYGWLIGFKLAKFHWIVVKFHKIVN